MRMSGFAPRASSVVSKTPLARKTRKINATRLTATIERAAPHDDLDIAITMLRHRLWVLGIGLLYSFQLSGMLLEVHAR